MLILGMNAEAAKRVFRSLYLPYREQRWRDRGMNVQGEKEYLKIDRLKS